MTTDDQRSWGHRNWKWALPLGCVGLLGLLALAILGLFMVVFSLIKSSEIYQDALARAQQHPSVQQALGEPVEPAWLVMGNVSLEGSSGEADLTIPIEGPHGRARVYAIASKRAGRWTYSVLEVDLRDDSERINLLDQE
jgi:hypothetical protein